MHSWWVPRAVETGLAQSLDMEKGGKESNKQESSAGDGGTSQILTEAVHQVGS